MQKSRLHLAFPLLALVLALPVHAETPKDFLDRYQAEARQSTPSFAPSVERGQTFFNTVRDKDWSCASCHTRNPAATGKHASTGKTIEPMAPAANPERFVSERTVEKWFTRNCKDVLGRVCSPAEKADVIAYLLSISR
ncbi:MAG TPA: DUF1924 domain-containing protein [Aromatoleum sp.]|uniref:DUF1924 domain-containing protein n=1 Tax=Aromatoleum sp. TaxID=2307007 RepID=UPI002B48548A|nr:DUF1924 domain-containing protein [Aromatoleum sp.]HJV27232.1 DUF1924 domain-containing protein [Aromatoleum sp.]